MTAVIYMHRKFYRTVVFHILAANLPIRTMKTYFLKLYQYNSWATKRVLGGLQKQEVTDEKILSIMGHVIAAQFLWLHRIKGLPPAPVKLWGEYSLPQLTEMADEAGGHWLEFVESTDDFNRDLDYINYVGDPYITNVEMIMIHLVDRKSVV